MFTPPILIVIVLALIGLGTLLWPLIQGIFEVLKGLFKATFTIVVLVVIVAICLKKFG